MVKYTKLLTDGLKSCNLRAVSKFHMRILKLLVPLLMLASCSSDTVNNGCGFLVNINVDTTINLNLPQFNNLTITGGTVRLPGEGNGGIILYRLNTQTLLAWDAADPSHSFSSCSIMSLQGTQLSCDCGDENVYTLATGQAISGTDNNCTLKPYRVIPIGDNVFQLTN